MSEFKPASVLKYVAIAAAMLMMYVLFRGAVVWNDAGYQTHIRTIFGQERVVSETGYAFRWFGPATAWPREMTVQSVADIRSLPKGDFDGIGSSVIPAFPITFLGGVTGTVDSNIRIILPNGDQFLQLAKSYRNPENFVVQSVIPIVKNTLQSTAQMMSADDYFGGGRSEFARSFADQMAEGIFLVRPVEKQIHNTRMAAQGAVAQDGKDQGEFGGGQSTIIVTEKVIGKDGLPVRLERQFGKLGILLADANVLNIDPNEQFKKRMVDVQTSQAQLMVARQGRQTADEQKKLVTAKGEMEVEEKRQITLRDQVEKTTNAETAKRLVIIEAEREQQKAEIERKTAQVQFEKAQIDAQTTKALADAEAYKKRVVIQANGALEQKLAAIIQINKDWAAAAQNAPVPGVVMGGGSGSVSRQADIGSLMEIMAAKAAKDLQLDMQVKQ
ncbi:SPFH domain-containing protein [Pseudomonas putida]|uniref:Membrane protease subunit, stomatin/prohibitin n=1 Tax=Pseudomonas putida TaxID=303 RepID=A0A8I1EEH8_PSEPU|nr:SPFH domain-containing protein [Pseudomonas putida]MBI6885149.1 membrane protease subunit, stomatin/prohibitin [Pseudomonas putida]